MPSIELKTNFHLSDPKEFVLGFSKVRQSPPTPSKGGEIADANAFDTERKWQQSWGNLNRISAFIIHTMTLLLSEEHSSLRS